MLSELFSLEKITNVCEKIMYFFVINLLFLVCNIPVLLFFLFVGISQIRDCLPLFLLCLSFLFLALSGVFFSMNRLLRGTGHSPWKDFWQGYCADWGQKMKLSLLQMFAVFILWTNIEFFAKQVPVLPLVILFGLLLLLVVLITPNLCLLASRYRMGSRKLVWNAIVLTIARPVNTLGTAAALGLVLMAFELSAGTAVLFMAGIYGFLVVFMGQKIMNDLEGTADKSWE